MASQQREMWAAASTTYCAAFIAFTLRLIARRIKRLQLMQDDFLATVAFIFATGFTVVNLYKIKFGLGLRLADIPATHAQASYDYFRLLWIDSWFYTISIGFSKLAALAFYWRIFGQSSIKVPIILVSASVVVWLLVRIVIIPIQCIPITKFWDRSVDGICPIKTNVFFFATTFPHLLIEIAIVVLPLVKIRQLQLPKAQKIAVGGMFMSGIIVIVASLVQLIMAFRLNTSSLELWWDAAPQLLASVIEVNLAQFSTSLPNLRPIFDIIVGKQSSITGPSSRSDPTSIIELSVKPTHILASPKNNAYSQLGA